MSAIQIRGSGVSSARIYVSNADIAAFISCARVHTASLLYKRNFLCPLSLLYFRFSTETEIPLRWSTVFWHPVGHFVWNALSRYVVTKERTIPQSQHSISHRPMINTSARWSYRGVFAFCMRFDAPHHLTMSEGYGLRSPSHVASTCAA